MLSKVRHIAVFFALALFSCSGNKDGIVEINSDADLAGLRVASVVGTCYDMELSARSDIHLQLYNSDSDVFQALINGKADVAINDEVVFNAIVRKENGVKIAHVDDQAFPTAFMFRKDEAGLARSLTEVQRQMVEDGRMQRLKDYWLTDQYAQAKTFPHIPEEPSDHPPIRVATCTTSAPLSFQVDGAWYGIEVDILRELGHALQRPLEIKFYDASSAIMALTTGLADVMCGCIFVTPEREEDYLFSEPYHAYHPAYFVLDRASARAKSGFISWFKKSIYKNLITENRWKYITNGLWETIKITVLAILLGSVLGVGLYAMTRSRRRWVRSCARVYNGFIAGIPELVLLLILFYVVFARSGIPPDIVAVISFALLFASGASGIYDSSLNAIPYGQTEAGLALGFTRSQTFFHIILPQAVRRGLPLYKGQCVSLLKGTSIVGYVAIHDLTGAGNIIRSRTFDALIPLAVITIIYFLLVWLLGSLLNLATPKKKVL